MICHACGKDTTPFVELDRGGPVKRCANLECRATIREAPPAAVAAPVAVPAVAGRSAKPRAAILPQPPAQQPTIIDAEPVQAAPMTATDMVAAMRERLSAVKAQLGVLAALRAEEALLERLLAAASDPPN
jgi:hypothetical protein